MYAPVTTRFVTYRVELDEVCRHYVGTLGELPAMREWHAGAAREPETRW
jgi:glutathione S-transferase